MVTSADALADQVRGVLQAELRSTDEEGHGADKTRVEERRVHDKGHDDRSEDAQTDEITVDRPGPTGRRRR